MEPEPKRKAGNGTGPELLQDQNKRKPLIVKALSRPVMRGDVQIRTYIAFWFFSKCGTAYRMAAGANLGEKLFGMVKTIGPVFQSYAPGLGLLDLAVGVAGAVILYFVVQSKIKKARKFRRDMEYGSARWSA